MSAAHARRTPARQRAKRAVAVAAIAGTAALGAASPALAAKGGGSPKNSGSSTLTLVLLNSTDGLPHWGQQITWNVSTTATTEPHVSVTCSQNGTVVYSAESGYYASYPWPWTQDMTLSSQSWTSGDADCTGALYYFNGSKTVTLTTVPFHVYA
jgi:hypothetical protein